MAQLVVRNLDEDVKQRLKERARRHGCSLEQEVRDILAAASLQSPEREIGLGTRIHNRFKRHGGLPPLQELRGGEWRIPDFSGPEFGTYEDEDGQ